MAVSKSRIESNLLRIRENIEAACGRSNRRAGEISIVAVTKGVDADTIKNALEAGLTDLGESRASQLVERADELGRYLQRRRRPAGGPPRWHMVGHLQRNKARLVIGVCEVIHSLDSLRLAEEINSRAESAGKTVDVMLQVNCSQEPQKQGVAVGAAAYLGELVGTMKNLRLIGLMTMAPLVKDSEQARPSFARLRELFEEMRHDGIGGGALRHLSMGMSNDYAVAVEEGATILRIGTALFE